MLFKRRTPAGWTERVRVALWPRRSWSRSSRYVVHRVSRLRGTPHFIALGFVAGAFTSFTPFMGFHFLLAALLAWTLGGSMLASALGTFIGNPITFPIIWISSYKLGSLITGADGKFDGKLLKQGFEQLWDGMVGFSGKMAGEGLDIIWPFFKPMLLGGAILGTLVAIALYFPARRIVLAYQVRRDERARQQEEALRSAATAVDVARHAQRPYSDMTNVHDLDERRRRMQDSPRNEDGETPNSPTTSPRDIASGR